MEIDTKQAGELASLIIFVLIFAMLLIVFYPDDFSMFNNDLLIEPIKIDAVTMGGWMLILIGAGAVGFFTSGNSLEVAVTGLVVGFCWLLYPIFVYIIDILTLGMFNYPNYSIHDETPLLLLLFIAIPSAIFVFYILFDLVTSALHSATGGD